MKRKQIFAALEIADHEVRLVVGEFHETRFNILRVERVRTSGVVNKTIVDEQNIISAIMKATKKASDTLGYRIERILLAIPSVDVTRFNKRVNVYVEDGSKRVRLSHIQSGINEAISYQPDDDLELVNIGCIKYITNGITSRKMPLNETCDVVTMNIDLLYANRETVYSYARCAEKAGLEIIDICLDSYAIAEEAAIFEQTVDKYVILVNLERQNTTLSLFTHGKLVSCEVLESGYGKWLEPLRNQYGLPIDVGFRLIQNTCALEEKEVSDSVVYIWSEAGESRQLREREVYACIKEAIQEWFDMINETSQPIIDSGNVRYVLSGEGLEIQEIEKRKGDLNAEAQIYVPQTIGARDCGLVTCLGLFYSWKTQLAIRKDERTSCDQRDVEKAVEGANKPSVDDESGFTKKLKSMLLNDK
ncbi:MAG: cell division protein FtsA [Erysipelotrichaceae bacterium]|nr:cell division protein FtsA [Erysipelotrichaceae bacterium]MCI9523899.1 cell division protein FtsA [Erysipelotrichaceae bacterium]